MSIDPRFDRIRAALDARPAVPAPRTVDDREAAVALVLRASAEIELLMIKRAERERDPWSGHMALPGGRRDPADADLLDTALRETREEVGLAVHRSDLLGALDEVHPRNTRLPSIIVSPYVVLAPVVVRAPDVMRAPDVVFAPVAKSASDSADVPVKQAASVATNDLVLDPREVEAALWVPLSALRDPTAVSELVLQLGDFSRTFPSIVYGEYTIWGLTHRILTQFLEVSHDAGVV